jgi:hypothetical protein
MCFLTAPRSTKLSRLSHPLSGDVGVACVGDEAPNFRLELTALSHRSSTWCLADMR